ncbi:hypothetical protein [Jiangella rhizosphaerae]|uniref:Uncharacterized protein n=1 Tax=Jiangella rhizosphaerae TaxID=2293569 RepID=A0A418KGZ5_9ACTN|nr:hypothetical protein [Jiangella rhizosphaerae]RIQ11349.1 hypothetical protein DY240_29075 [Jiangella rhizosphaerae]
MATVLTHPDAAGGDVEESVLRPRRLEYGPGLFEWFKAAADGAGDDTIIPVINDVATVCADHCLTWPARGTYITRVTVRGRELDVTTVEDRSVTVVSLAESVGAELAA